jgi:tol-pal system protein YbgF
MIRSCFLVRPAFALLMLALPTVATAQEPQRAPSRLEQFGRDIGSIFGQGSQQEPAPSGSPQMAQASPTDMLVRVDQLERQIRSLTGAIEQLQFRNQQLEQQIRRLEDEASRGQAAPRGTSPRTPPAAAVVPAPPPAPPPPPGRRNDAFDPAQNPSAPGVPRPLGSPGSRSDASEAMPGGAVASAGRGSDAIGSVIMTEENPVGAPGGREPGEPLDLTRRPGAPRTSEPLRANPPGPQTAALPPAQTPRDEYDLAYGYVLRKDYALAEEGLRGFLKKYPSDRLAGEAQFWLGESMFQRQKYRDAADAFVAMAKKYEGHSKAPDALLRLAQSLAALKEKELACATFGEVTRKYPRASNSVKQTVEREQKRVRC